jgi:hypothetical protein
MSEIDEYAEQIADDIIIEFDKWIRPELAKIVGWDAVNKIKDQDFESTFEVQSRMIFVTRSHTVRKDGATFYFKLCQGFPQKGKHTVLAKHVYDLKFEKYKKPEGEEWKNED